jgi:hypothetical protein
MRKNNLVIRRDPPKPLFGRVEQGAILQGIWLEIWPGPEASVKIPVPVILVRDEIPEGTQKRSKYGTQTTLR